MTGAQGKNEFPFEASRERGTKLDKEGIREKNKPGLFTQVKEKFTAPRLRKSNVNAGHPLTERTWNRFFEREQRSVYHGRRGGSRNGVGGAR